MMAPVFGTVITTADAGFYPAIEAASPAEEVPEALAV